MCAVAALNDKSLLLEIKNADGLDAYTYLKECLTHILSSQKSTGFEEFEAISKSVKELHRKSKTPAHVRKNPIELSFSKTQHGLYLSEEDKYEASGIDTDVEESLPNLADVFYRFETAGIGFNTVECVQLTLAIKALMKSQPIISARFWGKVFGLMQNYFVVETILSEEENAEEDEEDENVHPEEDHDKNTDELYDEDGEFSAFVFSTYLF
ncbi:unnamed protein product [Dicrocoelium dendriticum]|nr:unnamed protein product [Dicrocoelium dendriticum]